MKRARIFCVFLIAGVLAGLWCGGVNAAANLGQAAPELKVTQLDGKPFDLADQRGHVVIVNFWATWCGPCRIEMPSLDAFYRRHVDQGVEMIGISADRAGDRDKVVKAMATFAYPAGMLSDAKPNGFGVPVALPITYVVDGTGIVRAALTPEKGQVTEKTLSDTVLPLISARHGQ